MKWWDRMPWSSFSECWALSHGYVTFFTEKWFSCSAPTNWISNSSKHRAVNPLVSDRGWMIRSLKVYAHHRHQGKAISGHVVFWICFFHRWKFTLKLFQRIDYFQQSISNYLGSIRSAIVPKAGETTPEKSLQVLTNLNNDVCPSTLLESGPIMMNIHGPCTLCSAHAIISFNLHL